VALVTRWTGRESRALREALRMTTADMGERLGVSDRIVARWEASGEGANIRPVNQAALDTLLYQADHNVHSRFAGLLTQNDEPPVQLVEPATNPTLDETYVKHPTDGRLMTRIPEGVYLAGRDCQPAWLDEFWIDVHPVTNADYARFVAATNAEPPQHWPDGRVNPRLFSHPVVEVSHRCAIAYAAWSGKHLPSAEQWEKAARGDSGSVWPWGDQPSAAKCNVRETGIGATTPVDRYQSGATPYGVYDMVGNVWEWTSSGTTPGRYQLKGSAFTSPAMRGEPSAFNDANDFMQDDDTGFRCVALVDLVAEDPGSFGPL
jgi:formylglycine-generating enzyme required for sulfatase activity